MSKTTKIQTVRLSEIDGAIEFDDPRTHRADRNRYRIEVPAEDYLLLAFGSTIDHRSHWFSCHDGGFTRNGVLAVRDTVFHFKHDNGRGRKWWSQKAGRECLMAFERGDVEVILAPGCSYPTIRIGEDTLTLNVTGGTLGPEGVSWTDWIEQGARVLLNRNVRLLDRLIRRAIPDHKARGRVQTPKLFRPIDEPITYRMLVARRVGVQNIEAGWKLWIDPNSTGMRLSEKPWTVLKVYKRRQLLVCEPPGGHGGWNVRFGQVDWLRTIGENDQYVHPPVYHNTLTGETFIVEDDGTTHES